ncbi:glycerol-3-phosphate 1-O-acyltransferase [Actinomycetospora termitidis]|uniref:Glycerol-3-phosphate 1-O-acyltransferase n=1 Tax=Actinomycetospora termitidis TaxID=3053470 RepID=A0ABT7M1J9_9PSEU|nr:glycerol-3-phosphate 1-O-acyltransferase [Actinomycetospora sp. Odt1-22]MDL5154519.1 glycerol-3-phosphate 1-O-acyltransferase [Actinomycetospora sp. Odt1-22]
MGADPAAAYPGPGDQPAPVGRPVPATPAGVLPESGDRALVVLVDAPSVLERRLIDRWLGVNQPGNGRTVETVPAGGEQLAARLTHGDNPLLVPVRLVWELGGPEPTKPLLRVLDAVTRRSKLRDRARAAVAQGRWSSSAALRLQQERTDRQRHRVVVGRPATVRELLVRHRRERMSTETQDFVRFVSQQANLALDRAERTVLGNRSKVPREVSDQIVGGAHFAREVRRLAAETGESEAEVAAEAEKHLQGLVAAMDPTAVDMFSGVLRPMHERAWEVHADTSGLEPLRELNAEHALVFLPSHRSYTDPFVLAEVLRENDFPRNHVLGGNNLRIWGLEALARRSGIIFIRRSFGKDVVYKSMVREYFSWLAAKRFNLEWYMEGGRTRTGKLRPPKYGLLADVAHAVETRRTSDVYLVPVSITHDQLQEVHQMAAEQTGATKTPEGLRWLAGYARAQRRRVGSLHVAFGEPLSLRQALSTAGDPALERDPDLVADDAGDSPARRLALQKTAFEVFVRINRVTPVTPIALAALTLLGVRDRALTLSQVRRVVEPVLDYVEARKLPHTGIESLRTNGGVAEALLSLRQEKVVTAYTEGTEPVFSIEPGHHIVAAFYRNSAIHHFVNRAIVELAVLEVDDADDGREALAAGFTHALALRDLLKYEFFFPDKETFRAELSDELTLIDPDWTEVGRPVSRTKEILLASKFLCAHRVLRSFVDAQWVVAERLAAWDVATPVVEDELFDDCSAVGRQLLLQGRLHGPEALSRELFASALRLAGNRGLVTLPDGDPSQDALAALATRRRDFADEVRAVVGRVVRIDETDARNRQESTGVRP